MTWTSTLCERLDLPWHEPPVRRVRTHGERALSVRRRGPCFRPGRPPSRRVLSVDAGVSPPVARAGPMTLPSDTVLASYTIDRLLGRGGMGEVYLATEARLDRPVALKVLTPDLAADPTFRERFITESRLAAAIDHPHIVPIYEAGEADGRLFLAMRHVEGADLGEVIARDGRLSPDRAIGLLTG